MDDSELQVECPHCGAVFGVADGPAGRQATCPVCRGAVKVLDVQKEATATATAEGEQEKEQEKENDYFAPQGGEGLVTDQSGCCLVCAAREEKLNMLAVSPVLRSFAGLTPRDAARQVTHGMGILAERLAPDTALGMVTALKSKGVEAFAVPAEKAPEPVDRVHFTSIYDADAKALHVQMDPQGTVRALGWESVVAGVCTKARYDAQNTAGFDMDLDASGGGMPRIVVHHQQHTKADEPPLTLSLVLRDGQGRLHVMDVIPRQVRYAYLGQRITSSHDLNFAHFLTDLTGWAREAFFPDTYRQVAGGNMLRVVRPLNKVTHENYLRWAVCCAVARVGQPNR